MQVNNHTPFPHLVFRTGLEKDKIASALMLRVTYDIDKGVATPSAAQDWKLSAAPWESPYGPMESDLLFKRGGIDLFIFGSARTKNNKPAEEMDVRMLLPGKVDYKIKIFGERHWEAGLTGLRISEPKPFTEMPLTLANAYGGWDVWDEYKFPYPNNMHGKGFIWQKENAAGKQLPNIEDPKNLIVKWGDRPHPVGVCAAPMCEKRLKKSIEFDDEGTIVKFDHLFFNSAFPELVIKEITPGEEITVEGVTTTGVFKFKIPDHKIFADLTFGEKKDRRFFYIDQIGLEPDKNRAFITYRYAFNYFLNPLTKRTVDILN